MRLIFFEDSTSYLNGLEIREEAKDELVLDPYSMYAVNDISQGSWNILELLYYFRLVFFFPSSSMCNIRWKFIIRYFIAIRVIALKKLCIKVLLRKVINLNGDRGTVEVDWYFFFLNISLLFHTVGVIK